MRAGRNRNDGISAGHARAGARTGRFGKNDATYGAGDCAYRRGRDLPQYRRGRERRPACGRRAFGQAHAQAGRRGRSLAPGGDKLSSELPCWGRPYSYPSARARLSEPLCTFVVREAEAEKYGAGITLSGYDSMYEETGGAFPIRWPIRPRSRRWCATLSARRVTRCRTTCREAARKFPPNRSGARATCARRWAGRWRWRDVTPASAAPARLKFIPYGKQRTSRKTSPTQPCFPEATALQTLGRSRYCAPPAFAVRTARRRPRRWRLWPRA